jgi:uncharacterized caspase-like protein
MRAAFVLGSNGPESLGRLKRLSFAEHDAMQLARAISASGIGFTVTVPTIRTTDKVIAQFDEIAAGLQTQDELLFYFAGHGIVSHGYFYLVLDETQPGRLARTALSWITVKQIFQQSVAHRKVIILDCCHAGEAGDDLLGPTIRGEYDTVAISDADARNATASMLVACGRDGFARETVALQGGILTTLIVRALEPGGLTGRVSLETLRTAPESWNLSGTG